MGDYWVEQQIRFGRDEPAERAESSLSPVGRQVQTTASLGFVFFFEKCCGPTIVK